MDFAKAFDSVNHSILLAKLKSYGVTGKLWSWFADYLHGRFQRVVVDGVASQWTSVSCGFPQGSILGPILFTIFINDLPNSITHKSKMALYADDSKVYSNISSIQCCESLQQSLDSLNCWSNINNMRFNASKCGVLTVTKKLNPVNFDYHLGDRILAPVRKEKDLGVEIAKDLTWEQHISAVVGKANKMLGLLRRTCPLIKDTKVRRSLYLSLVKCMSLELRD